MPRDDRSLADLARSISSNFEKLQRAEATVTAYRLEIGRDLRLGKRKVPHGGWLRWLSENTPFSKSAAENYMRLAELVDEFSHEEKNIIEMSLNEAIAYLDDLWRKAQPDRLDPREDGPLLRQAAEAMVARLGETRDRYGDRWPELLADFVGITKELAHTLIREVNLHKLGASSADEPTARTQRPSQIPTVVGICSPANGNGAARSPRRPHLIDISKCDGPAGAGAYQRPVLRRPQ